MNKSADNLYNDMLEIIQRKMDGDPNVKEAEYQVAREFMQYVFVGIRFDREGREFPETIDDK